MYNGDFAPIIPAMTNYTTPSGTVYADYEYAGRKAWWAFDGDMPNAYNGQHYWYSGKGPTTYLQYTFDEPVDIAYIETYGLSCSVQISVSTDGVKAIRWSKAGSSDISVGKLQAYGIVS